MNKNIKNVCLLTLVLAIISIAIVWFMGRTYITSFKFNNNDNSFSVEGNDLVEVVSEGVSNGKYIVKLKAKKYGRVFLEMNYGDYIEQRVLYVHKTMIITDNNYFGYSRGSEVIPISLSIILIYILFLLIKEYQKSIKKNIYNYNNVAYMGIIIFISSFTIINVLSIINYLGVYDTINNTIDSMAFLSIFLFPIMAFVFILVTISNIRLLRKEGISLKNLLGLFLGIFICLLTLLPNYVYNLLLKSQKINIYNLNGAGPYIYDFASALVYLVVVYLECILIGTIVIAIKSVRRKVAYNKDYMLILGCKILSDGKLTPLLKGRVDKALEFRNNQLKETGKDLIFIPSGGKGDDEVISEAEAIKNYLLNAGIKNRNILVEDKSKNTYENINFSNKLIKDKNANVAFSTTNYHVFRAGLIATKQGLYLEGIGSRTKIYFWINAFIREFIGTLYAERRKHILVFVLVVIILIVMIAITYFANNI